MTKRTAEAEVRNTGSQQVNARVRSRAYQRLVDLHRDEYAVLLHEEKHKGGYPHLHGPDDPETITWWGAT